MRTLPMYRPTAEQADIPLVALAPLPCDDHSEEQISAIHFCCIALALFVFIARPADIFPVLAPFRLSLVTFTLAGLAFFGIGGPSIVRAMMPTCVRPMAWWVGIGLVSTVFSQYSRLSFEGWWRMQLMDTALCFFCLPAVRTSTGLRRVVAVIALAGAFLATCMFFLTDRVPADRISRASVGYFYDPNDIAMMLAAIFPLTVALFLHRSLIAKLLWGPLLVWLLLGIFATASRGGVVAFAAGCAMLLLTSRIAVKRWHKLLVLSLAVGFYMSPVADSFKTRWEDVLTGEDYNFTTREEGGGGRIAHWQLAARLAAKHPLTGVGVWNSVNALGHEYGFWRTPHSAYLQVALDLGVIGLVLFLTLLWTVWRNCTRTLLNSSPAPEYQQLTILAACTRITLVTYLVAAFFLSQAYSILVPVLLILSEGLHYSSPKHEASVELSLEDADSI